VLSLAGQRAEVGESNLPTFLFPDGATNMNNELIAVLEFWEREKGITKDVLLNAVQEALLSAAKKASDRRGTDLHH